MADTPYSLEQLFIGEFLELKERVAKLEEENKRIREDILAKSNTSCSISSVARKYRNQINAIKVSEDDYPSLFEYQDSVFRGMGIEELKSYLNMEDKTLYSAMAETYNPASDSNVLVVERRTFDEMLIINTADSYYVTLIPDDENKNTFYELVNTPMLGCWVNETFLNECIKEALTYFRYKFQKRIDDLMALKSLDETVPIPKV